MFGFSATVSSVLLFQYHFQAGIASTRTELLPKALRADVVESVVCDLLGGHGERPRQRRRARSSTPRFLPKLHISMFISIFGILPRGMLRSLPLATTLTVLSEVLYKVRPVNVECAACYDIPFADPGPSDVRGERPNIMNGGPASALGADLLPVSVRPMSPYVRPPLAIAFACA